MQTRHRRSLDEELMATEDAGIRRWKTCLHEAGHAVAGFRLLKRTVKAAVYEAGVGAAYLDIEAAIPRTFEEALAIAAGPAAEELAEHHAPPQVSPPPPPLTSTHPHVIAPLLAQLRQSPRDAVAIAHWCIGGIEEAPERWTNRFHWIRREAGLFVARHHQEIVKVAIELFQQCVISLHAPQRNVQPHDPKAQF